jgi:hypothetical protein
MGHAAAMVQPQLLSFDQIQSEWQVLQSSMRPVPGMYNASVSFPFHIEWPRRKVEGRAVFPPLVCICVLCALSVNIFPP